MTETELDEETAAVMTARIGEVAEFHPGDVVTARPEDDNVLYAGKGFEGFPLHVDEVFYTDDDVIAVDELDGTDAVNENRIVGDYYLEMIRYSFDAEFTTQPLPETRLIPWDEYDGPIHLRPHGDRYCYVEGGEECPICGRMAERWEGKRDSHDHAQTRSCAVCGYEKETEPS